MIKWSSVRVLAVVVAAFTAGPESQAKTKVECPDNTTCAVDLPGAVCADGTPMFLNITRRPGARRLYIYLQGGGACWDSISCDCHGDKCYGGTARHLTRVDPRDVRSGWSDPSVPFNPITMDYNIVEVPYCTGDLFIGNRLRKLGNPKQPVLIHQFGFRNMTLALDAIKNTFPHPQSIVMMGSSAGGLAAMVHLNQLRRVYPRAPVNVISDSGAPFKLPFVSVSGLERLIDAWGVRDNLPEDYPLISPGDVDFAGLLRYNAVRYPDHRYAFISSYHDWVMTAFSILLGAEYGFATINRMIRDIAAHDMGDQQKVFYLPGDKHTFHNVPPADVKSGNVHLGEWIGQMLNGSPEWQNHF